MIIANTKISIVIPALNESAHLPATLTIIKKLFGNCDAVIVADNGSTDNTPGIANNFGARVTIHPGVSIGELRNQGAMLSDAEVLVFIDADVHLDSSWPENFEKVVKELTRNPLTIMGSRCRAASQTSFVNRYWYSRLNTEKNKNYINSGHLIVTRELFNKIAGFSSELTTGEDYDFCQRALKVGATLKPAPELIAWHEGYPASLKGFMQREMWHGRNEYKNLSLFLESKVAIISTCHLLIFLLTLITLFFTKSVLIPVIYVLMTAIILIGLTVQKFGFVNIRLFLGSASLYYFYLIARSLAWQFNKNRPTARNRVNT
ncbi:glycosyl transferase family protein [Alishewanella agri BL06]|uniref:Glycosyl transferase family protein n=1 Tax=Alishewanella agri BL06 TaxID=1195246 RepID=I9P5R6_9ALTE|nr:glycosyltransferase [Alishewanella agri]EIW90362.1 glycosyl transferase family protein [Alishewanella agri BL06]